MVNNKKKIRISRFFKYLFLIVMSIGSVYPFVWMVFSATNKSTDVLSGRLWFGSHLKTNYTALMADTNLWQAFSNSLVIAFLTTIFALLICSMAGYGFEIYHDKAKDRVMNVILLSMMVPFAALMVPLFRMFSGMGLSNTIFAVILPTASTAFLIFMFRQSSQGFPRELILAARVDGLGEFRIFFQIYAPIMRPTYAAAATITFMNAWNSYMWPLVALQKPESKTMPIVVSDLLARYTLDYGEIMLSVLITTLPTLILFFALQKSFVNGILGAVK